MRYKIESLRFDKIARTTPRPDQAGFDLASRQWAEYCEAWSVYYRLPIPEKRRCYLEAVEAVRGTNSRRALEERLMRLHTEAKGKP